MSASKAGYSFATQTISTRRSTDYSGISANQWGISITPTGAPSRIIGLSGSLAFGSVVTNTTATRTLTISNSGNSALTVSSITYPAGFSGAWTGSIPAKGSQNVTVMFAPTAVTSYSGTVTVSSDATTGGNTISASGTGTAASIPPVGVLGIIGVPFTYQIVANNEPTWYSASGLPSGLSCDGTTGLISGIPTQLGRFWVTVEARNFFASASATLLITIADGAITSATSAQGVLGAPFIYQITANNSPTWRSASGLPSSLSYDGTTGLISGFPTQPGTFWVTVEARNFFASASATLSLSIRGGAIISATSAQGAMGVPFGYQIVADNNPTAYSASGLPSGLSCDGSTGLISGAATRTGTFSAHVEARNMFGSASATILFAIVDTTKPTLAITAPTAGQKMTNALANVKGTARDNWGVVSVQYQLNGGAWALAASTNGWTNWTAVLPLTAGTNVIKAYAVDLGGNVSATNTVSVVSSNTFTLRLGFSSAQPMASNGLQLSLEVSRGISGRVEVSTNLKDWTTLSSFLSTNATMQFRDSAATNYNWRFYRAVVP